LTVQNSKESHLSNDGDGSTIENNSEKMNQEEYNKMIEENCENLDKILAIRKNLDQVYFRKFNIKDDDIFNIDDSNGFDKKYLENIEHLFFNQTDKTEKKYNSYFNYLGT